MKNENLKKYKNIHNGKRVFLIGNGPSLSKTNLDLIKDEYSIAMCRISLIYDKTEWRPKYYIFASSNCQDSRWGKEWTDSVMTSAKEEKTMSFIWEKYHEHFDSRNKLKNVEWIKSITEKKPNMNGDYDLSWWPDNIEDRMDKSGTTMNLAIQLANYMGFSEIIFLGIDLGFSVQKNLNDDPNHFLGSYNADIPEFKVNKINNQMANVHRLARMKIPQEVKMYNASISTKVDIYPKICYETLMKENIKLTMKNINLENVVNYEINLLYNDDIFTTMTKELINFDLKDWKNTMWYKYYKNFKPKSLEDIYQIKSETLRKLSPQTIFEPWCHDKPVPVDKFSRVGMFGEKDDEYIFNQIKKTKDLIESIKKNGFDNKITERNNIIIEILTYNKEETILINGGNHRLNVLKALDYKNTLLLLVKCNRFFKKKEPNLMNNKIYDPKNEI